MKNLYFYPMAVYAKNLAKEYMKGTNCSFETWCEKVQPLLNQCDTYSALYSDNPNLNVNWEEKYQQSFEQARADLFELHELNKHINYTNLYAPLDQATLCAMPEHLAQNMVYSCMPTLSDYLYLRREQLNNELKIIKNYFGVSLEDVKEFQQHLNFLHDSCSDDAQFTRYLFKVLDTYTLIPIYLYYLVADYQQTGCNSLLESSYRAYDTLMQYLAPNLVYPEGLTE